MTTTTTWQPVRKERSRLGGFSAQHSSRAFWRTDYWSTSHDNCTRCNHTSTHATQRGTLPQHSTMHLSMLWGSMLSWAVPRAFAFVLAMLVFSWNWQVLITRTPGPIEGGMHSEGWKRVQHRCHARCNCHGCNHILLNATGRALDIDPMQSHDRLNRRQTAYAEAASAWSYARFTDIPRIPVEKLVSWIAAHIISHMRSWL